MSTPRFRKLASASFFCGLASPVLLVFTAIPAIILGHKSLRAAAREGQPAPGLAVTGLILGYLAAALSPLLALVFLGFGAGRMAVGKAYKAQAKNDCVNLVVAVSAFFDDYAKLPLDKRPQPLRTDGSGLIDVLTGNDPAENPKSIGFFLGSPITHPPTGTPGRALDDPWGTPYFVLLDTDYDEVLDDPFTGTKLRGRRALAWSAGPDGKTHPDPTHADNIDNVYSWK